LDCPIGPVGVVARRGLVCGVDQSGDVMREPPGEGVVGSRVAEFGEDALTEGGDRVSQV
jgi:hypothetical protein